MRRLIACLVAIALVPQGLLAAPREIKAPPVLAARLQPAPDGRAVMVEVPQENIDYEVDVGRVVSDGVYSSGALDYLFLDYSDTKRQDLMEIEERKAQGVIAPLRAALTGFDFPGLAMATTNAALGKVSWFAGKEPRLARVATEGERAAFAGIAGTRQFALIGYRHTLSPDFTQIRVYAEITIWGIPAPSKAAKATKPMLLSRHRMVSISELRKRSYEPADNVKLWSADRGKLARAALAAGLTRLETLIPRALAMTESEVAALEDKKAPRLFAAGFYGPRIEGADDGSPSVLIWSKGLVSAMPAPGS